MCADYNFFPDRILFLPFPRRTSNAIMRANLVTLELSMRSNRREEERIYARVLARKQCAGNAVRNRPTTSARTGDDTDVEMETSPKGNFASPPLHDVVEEPTPELPDDVRRVVLSFVATKITDMPVADPEVVKEIQSQHRLWCALVMFHVFLQPAITKAASLGYGGLYFAPFLPIHPPSRNLNDEEFGRQLREKRKGKGLPEGLRRIRYGPYYADEVGS